MRQIYPNATTEPIGWRLTTGAPDIEYLAIEDIMMREPTIVNVEEPERLIAENMVERISEVMQIIQASETEIHEMIAEEEPVAPAKKRRTVKKKEMPPFWKETTKGDMEMLPITIKSTCKTDWQDSYFPILSSPFVKYIPLSYVANFGSIDSNPYYNMEHTIQRYIHTDSRDLAREICNRESTGVVQLIKYLITKNMISHLDSRDSLEAIKTIISNQLGINQMLDVSTSGGYHYGNFSSTHTCLTDRPGTIEGRTFAARLSMLSCYMSEGRGSRNFTPQMLAVVLPENYMYQKEHMMLHGTIDLSKVIILMNKDLDNTDFPHKTFRNYFRKYILPVINQLKVDVWKVPVEFIQENCFHNGIQLKATSIIDKKVEIEQIVETFCSRYQSAASEFEESLTASSDDDDDEWNDEDYDDENE